MASLHLAIAAVLALRLIELAWSHRNTRRLLERGGHEEGAAHYPLFFLVHGGWLLSMALWAEPEVRYGGLLVLFLALQAVRLWVVASLGAYWTTRIITLPGAPLVRRGPFRWFRHPNYAVVAAEIAILPLSFGAVWIAVVFSALNGLLLWHRIGIEARALAPRRQRNCPDATSSLR